MARKQPPQQPPPVQRLRLRYAKTGPARFASHRDFSRAFERALRRAGVPMAYSSGFNPHPRISYANAAPTSAATLAEYVEIALADVCDPKVVMDALNEEMPPGMPILAVTEALPGTSLGDLLKVSKWQIVFLDADPEVVTEAVACLRTASQVEVERETKKGVRRFDICPSIVDIDAEGTKVIVMTRHGIPLVRPDDVVAGLCQLDGRLVATVLFTRLEQGELGSEGVISPPFE